MAEEAKYTRLRDKMVSNQIEKRGLRSPKVLAAMRAVPRHAFVAAEDRRNAYEDRPLLIGSNQTISQPYMVALMTDLLEVNKSSKVLEIGTGSGYQAAVLAQLAGQVYTIERHRELAKSAEKVLEQLGFQNVTVRQGDGSTGWPEQAPFDGIMVTAAAPSAPQPLLDQLCEGGRLVIPVGGAGRQELQVWEKAKGQLRHETIVPVSFVPLRGQHGWENDWHSK